MKFRDRMALGLAVAALLSGCGSSETGSFMIEGGETALTLERIKPYAWSDEWELELVVRRAPDCQRRHKLKPVTGAFKVQLYTPEPGVFIVKEGKRWYVTELKGCDLQAFKEPPPAPGKAVGTFAEKDGALGFVKSP